MKARGKKLEPKLGLDMPFGELLGRLIQTKPSEVEASISRSKQKRLVAGEPKRKGHKRPKQKGPAKAPPRRPK